MVQNVHDNSAHKLNNRGSFSHLHSIIFHLMLQQHRTSVVSKIVQVVSCLTHAFLSSWPQENFYLSIKSQLKCYPFEPFSWLYHLLTTREPDTILVTSYIAVHMTAILGDRDAFSSMPPLALMHLSITARMGLSWRNVHVCLSTLPSFTTMLNKIHVERMENYTFSLQLICHLVSLGFSKDII